ncbi:uncharacterized protein [Procambarus clarkii]|uniref:uncharacterized protein isoform X2 n=1 Tax=Procambarus clarkii TaxID=6728 RepID=UPI00374478B1
MHAPTKVRPPHYGMHAPPRYARPTKVPAVEGDPVAVWGHDTLTRRLAPSRPPPPTSHHLNTGTARMESFTPPTGPSARSKRSARHRRLLVTTTQRRRSAGRGRTGWVGGGRASRTLSSLHILPRAQPRSKTKYAPKLGIRHLAKPKTMYLRRSGVLSVESDPVAPAVLPTVALGAHHSTNASGTSGAPHSQVVLQEDPYLSPSFFRTDDDGQGFKHYRDFYQESGQEGDVENEAFEEGRNHAKPNVRSFAIPETIVKDGQVFYRYDGGIDGNESIKGQSKRSHARDGEYLSDDGNQNVAQHDLQSSDDHLPTSGTSDVSGVGYPLSHNGFDFYVGPSRVQTQAHIGERSHGATAEAVVDSGPATQVVGSAGVGGFFSAQAQSGGHPGGTSHSQVMGNMHGVQGSAVAHNNGHQSQAHVNMGAHSSSRAQVSTHEGASILVSSVDATQLGGSAGAQAHSSSAAKSQAQMDFNPIQHYDETGGLRGQGLASATMTSEGGSALATLTGQVTRGSYLGVAHSSSGTHHLADTHPSQPHFIPEHSTRNHLSVDDNMLTGDESQEEFAHIDFLKPESGQEEYSEEQHLHTDFVPVEVIRDSLPQEQEDQDDKWEGIVIDDLADPGLLQDRGREDSPRLDESGTLGLGRNIASAHDMLSSIVETVHQPHMVDSYPNTGHIIDAGGLVGGSGQPPKESEVGQAPIHTRPYIDEGVGILTGNIKKGVGLATYSQGSLGPAPSPGEIVNISPSLSPYDYDHTSSEYYDNDYNIVPSQQPPYFDLGPEIFNLQPIELSYEHLQPTDSAVLTPEAPVQLNGGQDKAVPPDPPIVIHQVQTSSPHLPGGSPSPSPHTPPLPLVEAIMPALHQQPNSDEGRGSSSQPEYRPWVGQAGTDEARPWVGQAGTDEARPWVGQAGTDEARPWVGQAGTDEARPWVGQAGTDEARPWVGQAGTDEARPWVGQAGTDEARPWVGQAGTDEARPWVGQAGTDEARPWVGQAGTDEARPWVGQAGTDEARPWVGQAGTDEAEPEHRPWVGQVGTADAESEHRPWVGQVGTADAEPEHRPWVGQVGTADAEPEHRPWVGQVGTADAEPEHRPWVGQAGTADAEPDHRPWVGQVGTADAEPDHRPWVGQVGTADAEPDHRPWVGQVGTADAEPEHRPWVGQVDTADAEPEHRPWVGQVGTADAEPEHRPWVGQVGTADAEPDHRPWVGQVGTADAEPEHRPWVGQVGTADAEPEHRPWVGQAGTAEAQQVRGTEDMVTVPLVATSPGTSITLPGTTGGPVINVMTMSASQNMINSSLLAQRPGSPIQPGEKIPGAPGYRVPSGFRGHVILGHKLPVEADSRRVVEGFNTHVRLTPQDTLPNVVFASVGGPHTSQHLPEDNVPGVHVTLSGSEHSQSPVSSAPSSRTPETTSTSGRQVTGVSGRQRPYSQQRVEAAATGQVSESAPWLIMESLRPRNPELTHSSMLVQPVLPGKSWDGVGSMKTSGNSWGRTWSSSNRQPWGSGGSSGQKQPAMCKYYTISCQVVYSPYQQSKRCKPTYTTRECCC